MSTLLKQLTMYLSYQKRKEKLHFFPLTFWPLPNLTANVDSLVGRYDKAKQSREEKKKIFLFLKQCREILCVFKMKTLITYTLLTLLFPKIHHRVHPTGLTHF